MDTIDALLELKALAAIINDSISTIEKSLKDSSLIYPSLRAPFTPDSEAARSIPEVQTAGGHIISAAAQMIAIVRPPPLTMIAHAQQFNLSTAIRIALITHTAEILRGAGIQGMHVQDIAKPTKTDPTKFARVLRLLATNHIFVEVSPDVFANNRLSSVLDTGKSIDEIIASPDKKHDGPTAFGALLEHLTHEVLPASSALPDVLLDPQDGHSNAPNKTAFNKAFNTDLTLFEWFNLPENARRMARFNRAMEGGANAMAPDTIIEGFDWGKLPDGSLVIDVGGGIGNQCASLAEHFPQLSFVVQDQVHVIHEGVKFWKSKFPGHIESGKVILEAHDFFAPQPARNVSVFLLRLVLHDWPDSHCLTILRALRAAADPELTKLVVFDNILSYACPESGLGDLKDVRGAERAPASAPLLPNFGHANTIAYSYDLSMMSLFNSQERTVLQFQALMEQSGWKLVEVFYGDPFAVGQSKAIAIPV
ncbi:S-adenosyl-L-methionine-dependent methyltransferase [Mycena venus]|uniref:S-adenosyl-L-methionine-dependent methyltransferase n=1 Tax=Mycena venus TaxID=2733690 RepID=A0A8H6XTW6_9AGAR|nr:S-adenosyl-L-methionine-dependent methyltransferase [Mycena venus]